MPLSSLKTFEKLQLHLHLLSSIDFQLFISNKILNSLNISFLMLSELSELISIPPESSQHHRFSDDFRGNRSKTSLNLLNILSENWR